MECTYCGLEFPEYDLNDGICKECFIHKDDLGYIESIEDGVSIYIPVGDTYIEDISIMEVTDN